MIDLGRMFSNTHTWADFRFEDQSFWEKKMNRMTTNSHVCLLVTTDEKQLRPAQARKGIHLL